MSLNSLDRYFQTLRPLRRVGKLRGVIELPAFDVDMGPEEVSFFSQNSYWNNSSVTPEMNDGTGLTLEAWVKVPAGVRTNNLTVLRAGGHQLVIQPDMTIIGRFNNGGVVNVTSAQPRIPRDQWTHVATTCDGSVINVYVNFVLVATGAFTGTLAATTGTVFRIADAGIAQNQAGMFINEARLWNYARTADEIQYAAYTNRDITGVIDVGLNLYFPFDEGTGTTVDNQIAAKAFTLTQTAYGGGNPAWVTGDSYPYRLGASYISGWFLLDTSGRSFSFKFPVRKPSSTVNFVPVVSWIESAGVVTRYRLWEQDTLAPDSVFDVWPEIPVYNGEVIPDGAKIEIWNLDGERDVVLSEAIDIDTSILNIVTDPNSTTQTATATLATPVVTEIAAVFPISFPLTFNQPQTF